MKKFLCYNTNDAASGKINVDNQGMLKPVDSELSDTSTNPVQNRVVKSALDALSEENAELKQDLSNLTEGISLEEQINLVYDKYVNKYVNKNGQVATSASAIFQTSDPVEIKDGMQSIKIEVEGGNQWIARIVFLSSDILYDGNIIWYSVDASKPLAEYQIPKNAKYFCVSKDVDSSGVTHGDYPHVTAVTVKKV